MPNQTQEPEAPFVPYTIDVTSEKVHEVLHTALGLYAKSLEALAKKMEAAGVNKDGVVELLGVCDDTASLLDGQYVLFNQIAAEPTVASETADMFAGADEYEADEE